MSDRPEDQADPAQTGPTTDQPSTDVSGEQAATTPPPEQPAASAAGQRRRRAPVGLIVGGVVALILIGLIVWAIVGGGKPQAMRYLPDHSKIVATFAVSDWLQSDAYQLLHDDDQMKRGLDQMIEQIGKSGIDPQTITRVTIAGATDDLDDLDEDGLMIVTVSEPVDQEKVRIAFAEDHGPYGQAPQTTRASVGDYEIHHINDQALTFIDDRTLIIGAKATVEAVLERDGSPDLSEGMKRAIGAADFDATIAMAVNLEVIDPGPMAPTQVSNVLGRLSHMGMAMNVGDSFDARIEIGMAESDDAAMLKEVLEGISAGAALMLDLPEELMDALRDVQITAGGQTVTLEADVAARTILDLRDHVEAMERRQREARRRAFEGGGF